MSEDIVPYGNRPTKTFMVYKFNIDPDNPELDTVQVWNFLSTEKDYKRIIPANYSLCHSINIQTRDYYLVVHLRQSEEATCYYYINSDSTYESLLKVAVEN